MQQVVALLLNTDIDDIPFSETDFLLPRLSFSPTSAGVVTIITASSLAASMMLNDTSSAPSASVDAAADALDYGLSDFDALSRLFDEKLQPLEKRLDFFCILSSLFFLFVFYGFVLISERLKRVETQIKNIFYHSHYPLLRQLDPAVYSKGTPSVLRAAILGLSGYGNCTWTVLRHEGHILCLTSAHGGLSERMVKKAPDSRLDFVLAPRGLSNLVTHVGLLRGAYKFGSHYREAHQDIMVVRLHQLPTSLQGLNVHKWHVMTEEEKKKLQAGHSIVAGESLVSSVIGTSVAWRCNHDEDPCRGDEHGIGCQAGNFIFVASTGEPGDSGALMFTGGKTPIGVYKGQQPIVRPEKPRTFWFLPRNKKNKDKHDDDYMRRGVVTPMRPLTDFVFFEKIAPPPSIFRLKDEGETNKHRTFRPDGANYENVGQCADVENKENFKFGVFIDTTKPLNFDQLPDGTNSMIHLIRCNSFAHRNLIADFP